MFANRFTAFIDACCLMGVLKRDLLLTLAEAEFFRVRWSAPVLDEAERAIATTTQDAARGRRSRLGMEAAFEDAMVDGFECFLADASLFPDAGDHHVVAAALCTRADVIVTDNLKHFPAELLAPLRMEARSADDFLADTMSLDIGHAVAALRARRSSYRKPPYSAEEFLRLMEGRGLLATADLLRPHIASL